MGRHKWTFRAKLNTRQQPTIDRQGRFRFGEELETGDPGRRVEVAVTEEELEWALKALRDGRSRHAVDRVRSEQAQRVVDLRCQVSSRDRRIAALEQRTKELEQAIDGAHAVAHKDQAVVTSQADPFAFLERPDASAKPH